MPLTSQTLYFHLGMNADDYGFVSPKRIMRMIGAMDDDLKILIAKRYILPFDSGVVVVKHWHLNNTIRKDRSNPTTYGKEFKSLTYNEFGAYTEVSRISKVAHDIGSASAAHRHDEIAVDAELTTSDSELTDKADKRLTSVQPNDNHWLPQIRLDKIRLDKISNTINSISRIATSEITEFLDYWESKLGYKVGNENGNRKAIAALYRQHGKDTLKRLVDGVVLSQEDQYAPRISDFVSLKRKQNDLLVWGRKRNKQQSKVAQI